ncbi:putative hydrolase or acyltransferase of alpha/beta superfamily [Hyella patelloides LEGE 07179]|uniref:Putative hydrolase or acyltransferase of alpha/beta superfamily n=1 Tax=Hyella patelloides LEGE 07179 TaxID=945734 RepID=A0A563W2V2_9CYAN|nr:alpha/beta hydrolase [Hyella patelloides]VEP18039.1 putative hydrolase or acyltransferase of alpha/beta superfamily [Hyella patelloides LEGE 07179]
MPLINVRGVNHYYEWIRSSADNQQKPVMVFVHGWGGSARYWHSTAIALSEEYDCLLYDLRGFGRSSLPTEKTNLSYDLEEYAEDLIILLNTLEIDRVYLHAHSMGSSIATLFINRYSDRVHQAVLACNGIFEYDKRAFAAFHKFGSYVVKFRYNWFLQVPFADRMFMARFLSRPIQKSDRFAFLEDFLLANYEAALGTIYTSVSKQAVDIMPKEFAQIKIHTLMVSGEKDQIIPAKMGKQASQLNPQLEYQEILNTGHFPMLEAEETYLEIVKSFLAEPSKLNNTQNRNLINVKQEIL